MAGWGDKDAGHYLYSLLCKISFSHLSSLFSHLNLFFTLRFVIFLVFSVHALSFC